MKYQFLKALVCCSFILALSCSPQQAYSQRYLEGGTSFWNNVSFTGNIGTTLFFGDVSNDASPYQEDWKLGYGLIIRKQLSPIFGLGFQFMTGQLHGTKLTFQDGSAANLYFDADLMEFNVHTVINFSNLIWSYKPERTLNLYGYLGIGVANWNTVLKDFVTDIQIATSGFDNTGAKAWTPEMIYPVGMGVNIMMSQRLDLNIDAGIRMVNSDDVDARVTGNSKSDFYSYASVGLTFKFSGGGGIFRSAKNKDIDYDKEARKQQKYQDRQLRKDEKRSYRKKLEDQRLEENKTGKRGDKPKRRVRDDGLPKVAEYDAVYTKSQAEKLSADLKAQQANTYETVASTEVVVDEGKHFITGAQNLVEAKNEENNQFIDKIQKADLNTVISANAAINIPNQGLVYTVQILATRVSERSISSLKSKYSIDKQIYVFKSGALYRYSAGLFNTYDEALVYSRKLHYTGASDAFVTAYENGVKIQRTK